MPKVSIRAIASVLAIIFGVAAGPFAAEIPCDPRLIPIKEKSGYRIREKGVRCEGFFITDVASSGGLEPISLLRGHLNFQHDSAAALIITAPGISSLTKEPVRVRAMSVPTDIHYRMDAAFQPRDSILWLLKDVIYGSGLTPDKIGVFGWIGNDAEKTYVPLRIHQRGVPPAGQGDSLVLAVRSWVYIDYLEFSLFEVGTGVIEKRKKLIEQLVFPGEKIEIPIPDGHPAELLVTMRAKEYQRAGWLPVLTIKIMRP